MAGEYRVYPRGVDQTWGLYLYDDPSYSIWNDPNYRSNSLANDGYNVGWYYEPDSYFMPLAGMPWLVSKFDSGLYVGSEIITLVKGWGDRKAYVQVGTTRPMWQVDKPWVRRIIQFWSQPKPPRVKITDAEWGRNLSICQWLVSLLSLEEPERRFVLPEADVMPVILHRGRSPIP